jgi:transcription-repair coupling factor (superfamily II helicase)
VGRWLHEAGARVRVRYRLTAPATVQLDVQFQAPDGAARRFNSVPFAGRVGSWDEVDFRLDDSYVPDMNQRLMIYRRMAGARSEDEIGRIVDEVRDRYGPSPTAVLNLADFARIRVLADALGVETIDRADSTVVIKFRQKTKVDLMRVIALVQERGDLQLVPPNSLKLDLKYQQPTFAPPPKDPGATVDRPRRGTTQPWAKIQRKPSWWTARATAGEVTPGFTKAEILRPAPEDPRAPDGVLSKVTGLLEELDN